MDESALDLRERLFLGLRRRWDLVLLAIFASGLYGNSILGGFIWDDKQLVGGFNTLKAALTREFLTRSFYRPIPALSIYLNTRYFGESAAGFHLTNIALHAAAVVLLYLLMLRLTSHRVPSLIAATVFAALSVHVEAVAWVSGRTDLFCAVFFLGALLAHIRYVETQQLVWLRAAAAAFLAALFSKELAAVFPVVVFTYEWAQGSLRKRPLRVWLVHYMAAGMLYVAARIIALKPWLPASPLQSQAVFEHAPLADRVLALPVNLARYLGMIILPHDPVPFYSASTYHSLPGAAAAASLILLLIGVGAFFLLRSRLPVASLGLAVFGLTLLPACNLVQLPGTTMAERFTYLPSGGLALVGATILSSLFEWRPRTLRAAKQAALILLPAVFIATCGYRTVCGNLIWRDEMSLWTKTVAVRPDVPFAYNNLGKCYEDRGMVDTAEGYYRKAIGLDPKFAGAHASLGNLLRDQGDLRSAADELRTAVRLDPHFFNAVNNLGGVLYLLKDYSGAENAFRSSLKLVPQFTAGHVNLALVYESTGRWPDAVREYEEALKLQPELTRVRLSLGKAYLAAGRREDARRAFMKVADETANDQLRASAQAELDRLGGR